MKQMSIRKQIRVQRLQDKNRMVGQTFNPSGITSEQIRTREQGFVIEMKSKTQTERQEYWNKIKPIIDNWEYSWDWQWCVFQRHFVSGNTVY
jgi:hypothetical protein